MIDEQGVTWVDNSTLKSVAACSTQAHLRYILDYTTIEEAATLKSGHAAHLAIAEHFRGKSRQAALNAFEFAYRAWSEEHVAPDDRLYWINCYAILDRWIETHALDTLPYGINPQFVEVGFAYPLVWTDDEKIVVWGRMDAIAHYYDTKSLYTYENKTTGKISSWKIREYKIGSQNSCYKWAADQHLGEAVVGALVNVIEFSRLPSDPTRKCKTHATPYGECGRLHANFELVPVTRGPGDIAEWKKSATHLARRYRDLLLRYPAAEHIHRVRMQGIFHGACAFCQFYTFCSLGRPKDLIGSMFRVEPWKPTTAAGVQLEGVKGDK